MYRKTTFFALLWVICLYGVCFGQTETKVDYFAIFMDGQKVGHSINTRLATEKQVTNTEEMVLTIARAGISLTVTAKETMVETLDGKPVSFESVQDLGLMKMVVSGKMNEQGKLEIVSTGPFGQNETVDWPAGALMSEGMDILAKKLGLKEGTKYKAKMFVPSMPPNYFVDVDISIGETKEIDLLGRITPLTEVKVSMVMPTGAVDSISYVNKDYDSLKMVSPVMGINMEVVACDKVFALSENDTADFLDRFLLPVPAPINNVNAAQEITYHLQPINTDTLNIPVTDNQTVRKDDKGNTLVTVKPLKAASGQKIPYVGKDPKILQALKPNMYVQSNDPAIVKLAKTAINDTTDAAEAAKKIEKFVYDYIDEKNLAVGYATASEVTSSKKGDCSEHAVLTAALCQAAGIPAQVVTGLLYVDNFAGKNNIFGPHAWVQAYIGGKWIGLDATRADKGFMAGYISLAVGDGNPEGFFGMVNTLGYFKIVAIEQK